MIKDEILNKKKQKSKIANLNKCLQRLLACCFLLLGFLVMQYNPYKFVNIDSKQLQKKQQAKPQVRVQNQDTQGYLDYQQSQDTSELQEEYNLSIGQVAKILNLPVHTIRFWTEEFNHQIPYIVKKGDRRYYSQGSLAIITKIQKLIHKDGIKIKNIKEKIFNEQAKKPHFYQRQAYDGSSTIANINTQNENIYNGGHKNKKEFNYGIDSGSTTPIISRSPESKLPNSLPSSKLRADIGSNKISPQNFVYKNITHNGKQDRRQDEPHYSNYSNSYGNYYGGNYDNNDKSEQDLQDLKPSKFEPNTPKAEILAKIFLNNQTLNNQKINHLPHTNHKVQLAKQKIKSLLNDFLQKFDKA